MLPNGTDKKVLEFASSLRGRLNDNPEVFSEAVVNKLWEIVDLAEYAAKMIGQVELLYVVSENEKRFLERVNQIEQGRE